MESQSQSAAPSPFRSGTGLVLGKFMPPHLGHVFLVDFARHHVADLVVLVCSIESEPIPGELRFEWMRELFPQAGVRVVHVTDELPQQPEDDPNFWPLWREAIHSYFDGPIDYVFASEPYGYRLAAELGARYIPVDHARSLVQASGTAVRNDPMANWRSIPPCVRPYYVKRVCIVGPESTGKTTLATQLAAHYDTAWVSEHARPLLDHKQGQCDPDEIPLIARGQLAAEEAMARQANRVLICDTDLLLTTVWSDVLYGRCDEAVRQLASSRRYDLCLLADIDVPWVDDGQRYLPHLRESFFEQCKSALEREGRSYVTLSGNWEQRFVTATKAIDALLQPGGVTAR